ncbi:hypothetical protein FKB34_14080 [Glycocaulis profundi]|nr:hypothetical protein FKB34_14080 [Glycocaulis profundi]
MARRAGRTGRVTMTALVFIGAAWVFDQAVWPLIRMMTAGDGGMLVFGVALIHLAVIAVAYAALRGRISTGLFVFMSVVYGALALLAFFFFSMSSPLRLPDIPLAGWESFFAWLRG